jgi:hypothetical protein
MESPPPFPDQLRDKALLALEDAVQECRWRTPRPSFAVRFALAYLWVHSGCGDRKPYDELWSCLRAPKRMWTFSAADQALSAIYSCFGLERPSDVGMAMWKRWAEHERRRREEE